tara:strand:+ start:287 stop:490 length:204 start_codon:yes stop_codon:yes gene_type:complete
MNSDYILLFITGFLGGAVSIFYYLNNKLNVLRANQYDKALVLKLIKEHAFQPTDKQRQNGKPKKKKA